MIPFGGERSLEKKKDEKKLYFSARFKQRIPAYSGFGFWYCRDRDLRARSWRTILLCDLDLRERVSRDTRVNGSFVECFLLERGRRDR